PAFHIAYLLNVPILPAALLLLLFRRFELAEDAARSHADAVDDRDRIPATELVGAAQRIFEALLQPKLGTRAREPIDVVFVDVDSEQDVVLVDDLGLVDVVRLDAFALLTFEIELIEQARLARS